jgi:hypothetical protein
MATSLCIALLLLVTPLTHAGALPNPAITPGATDPRVTQENISATICTKGYTKTVRPSAAAMRKIKAGRMLAYGIPPDQASLYEADHLVA